MKSWILSFFIMAIESWGSLYFFDTFMEQRKKCLFQKCRYLVFYLMILFMVLVSDRLQFGMRKLFLITPAYTIFCLIFYRTHLKQSIFFSALNYSLLFLLDFFILQIRNIWVNSNFMQEAMHTWKHLFSMLFAKMVWLCMLFVLRKLWKGKNEYNGLSGKEWIKLSIMPLFTMATLLLMVFYDSADQKIQAIYLFVSFGLIISNFIVVELMQSIIEKEKLLQKGALASQKNENQLAYYRDMQVIYERQGRKMHDYKNQLQTIQILLKKDNIQTAVALAEHLTESISVEMSAVNTNHPIVNAVLNQKFHAAREQGISMIFKIDDMHCLRLNEEEIVVLLSNLLDNAICACRKVLQEGKRAVIHIKLIQDDEKVIISVKNPIAEKIQIVDNMILDSEGKKQGIGLINVKTVTEKYAGSFAISCDEESFHAVAIV